MYYIKSCCCLASLSFEYVLFYYYLYICWYDLLNYSTVQVYC